MLLITDILYMIGSAGLLVFGMKITSESLQRMAGEHLVRLLQPSESKKNFLSGIWRGFTINALMQSSLVTSSTTISYASAGLLSFHDAMYILMGINLGSSLTAWFIALVNPFFSLTYLSVITVGAFVLFIFFRNYTLKNFAEFGVGIGIFLMGAGLLDEAVKAIQPSSHQDNAWQHLITHGGYLSVFIFLLIGGACSFFLQSSSSVVVLAMIFYIKKTISLDAAAAWVLGENMGTSLHSMLTARGGNIHAKRAAGFYIFFNIAGLVWIILFLPLFLEFTTAAIEVLELNTSLPTSMTKGLSIPLFHLLFNMVNILLLAGFIPVVERYLLDRYPTSSMADNEFRLRHPSHTLLATPELALVQAKKELQNFARIIEQMSEALSALLFEKGGNEALIIQKLTKREEQTDKLELEVISYLTKLSESELSQSSSMKVSNMLNMANNLERIADIYYQMTKNHKKLEKMNIRLSPEALHDLQELLHLLHMAIRQMRLNMEADASSVQLETAYEIERRINTKHKQLTALNFDRLEKGVYDPRAGLIFMDFINRAERIGDHIINVNEALASKEGFIVKKTN